MAPDPSPHTAGVEKWKTEYDILLTLRELGHEVKVLGVLRDLEAIEEMRREWEPDVVFNMLEDVYGIIPYDHNMVAYLERLGLAYTGCNPLGMVLSRDKGLTKKLMTYHKIRVPKFIVCRRGQKVRRPKRLDFPLIVKSLIDRVKNKFNVSIAEVGDNDVLKSATIGAAVVSNENSFAQQVISKLVDKINNHPDAVMIDYNIESY